MEDKLSLTALSATYPSAKSLAHFRWTPYTVIAVYNIRKKEDYPYRFIAGWGVHLRHMCPGKSRHSPIKMLRKMLHATNPIS